MFRGFFQVSCRENYLQKRELLTVFSRFHGTWCHSGERCSRWQVKARPLADVVGRSSCGCGVATIGCLMSFSAFWDVNCPCACYVTFTHLCVCLKLNGLNAVRALWTMHTDNYLKWQQGSSRLPPPLGKRRGVHVHVYGISQRRCATWWQMAA